MALQLYNTRTKEKAVFHPLTPGQVRLYACGPTVYNYVHIGNLRSFLFEDILYRTLKFHGYDVTYIMNITDVGHLTDDADQGEDKMEKGAARDGKTAWDVASYYTNAFQQDIAALAILPPTRFVHATDHIDEQIAMVQTLLEKGHAYQTADGIYFDTTTIDDYGKLANLKAQDLQAGVRVDMGDKRNVHDFALWKFSRATEHRQMEWDAFGQKGFPGWHIECSAMSTAYLGDQFDIHCGGIDHIPVHHTNEIAQTEAVTGKKPWVNVWMHNEFVNIQSATGDIAKMAKSGENFITLQTLIDKGYDPLAYRFFLLQSHYRKQVVFSYEALDAAAAGYKKLRESIARIPENIATDPLICDQFDAAINDDLNTAKAIALIFDGLKKQHINLAMITRFDKILGLALHNHAPTPETFPAAIQQLLDKRAKAREQKKFDLSDTLRDELASAGYRVEDTSDGQRLFPL